MDKVAENIEIDEGRMKDIFTADQEGKSAKEIAKALKLPLGTVKRILGEENELIEFTDSQLDVLARHYKGLAGKTISIDQANKLRKIFKGVPDRSLDALRRKKIPFLSGLALSRMVQKGMPVKESNLDVDNVQKGDSEKEKELKIKLDKEKDQDTLEKQLIAAQGQINILKQKLENEKNKAIKPEPNPDTGEVPLAVGLAQKLLRDKEKKETQKPEIKKEDLNKDDEKTIKPIIKQLKKSVTAHDKQAKDLEKAVKEETIVENSKKDKEKRLQRAKDMIRYYDMLKKKALKGPNKELAKKMLKSDVEKDIEEGGPGSGPQHGDKRGTYKTGHKKSYMKPGAGKRPGSAKDGGQTDKEADDYDTEMGEADLTKSQIKKVHKMADELPKKSFRDRYGKEKGDAVRYGTATNMVKKKMKIENSKHPAKMKYEEIAGLRKKADKSGMPYGILKKVYDRGMAAWKGGHRPGASQHQWAFARVNSFVTKSSGTWGGADKDLAAKVKGK